MQRRRQPHVELELIDSSSSTATMRLHVRRDVEAVPACAAVDDLWTVAQGVSDCDLNSYQLVYSTINLDRKQIPPTADVHNVGVFIFSCQGEDNYAIIEIKGFKSYVVQTGPGAGILIDTQQPEVSALINEMINGPWCNPFGYKILKLEAAFMQVRAL